MKKLNCWKRRKWLFLTCVIIVLISTIAFLDPLQQTIWAWGANVYQWIVNNSENPVDSLIGIIQVIATFLGGLYVFFAFLDSRKITLDIEKRNEASISAERFSQAVEMLGRSDLTTCLGGIYSLEQVVKVSPEFQGVVIDVLVSFIKIKIDAKIPFSEDERNELIRSALSVLGRRDISSSYDKMPILRGLNLAHLFSYEVKDVVQEFQFVKLDLGGCDFQMATLLKPNFSHSNLSGAKFSHASLTGANFTQAKMTYTKMKSSSLIGCIFDGTDLQDADFQYTSLKNVNLERATNLSVSQVTQGKDFLEGKYQDDFLKELKNFMKDNKAASEDTALTENSPNTEDSAWLNSDLSNLGAYEPYEWAEGELEEGKPIKYILGKGLVIEE